MPRRTSSLKGTDDASAATTHDHLFRTQPGEAGVKLQALKKKKNSFWDGWLQATEATIPFFHD